MGLFATIQSDIETRLESEDFFKPEEGVEIPVIPEDAGDVESQIEIAVSSIGACCIVMAPKGNGAAQNASLMFSELQVRVRVVENVTLNRAASGTAQPALLILEAVAWFLHGFTMPNAKGTLVLVDFTRVDDDLLIYDAIFKTRGGIAAAPTRQT